ncbi:MAG TPA: TraR/DksA C4-type zinc finger protein [Rhodanobacteraceae bacterium]|nr:TraR/DksA C4-type zinc finger protein [Rhodanobacteraceae bacterium]
MTTLKPEQTLQLVRLMDERYARERREIDTITMRSLQERGQAASAGPAADRLDVAMADTAMATDDAMVRQNMQDMRDIDAARKRLASGSYGICIDCGEPVGFERLLAYPTAKRCIECQRLHEQ